MGEWWTYGVSDFLMFSPRAHARLVAAWNAWLAPASWIVGLAGPAALLMALRAPGRARRWGVVLLAVAWAWVGWAFHWQRHATLFLGAGPLAVAFGIQSGLLMLVALQPGKRASERLPRARAWTGWTLFAAAVLGWPLATGWAGGSASRAEFFGWMPDPTALATLGLLVAGALPAGPAMRRMLTVIPLLAHAAGLLTRGALFQYGTA